MEEPSLTGEWDVGSDDRPTILVVEDEFLISVLVADALSAAGFRIVGPVSSLADALAAARSEAFDAALLDIQLAGGEDVYPVAEVLAERGIPFAFVSSRPKDQIDYRFIVRPVLSKPFSTAELQALAASLTR
jgi:DNA-binding response OmpR family regulator